MEPDRRRCITAYALLAYSLRDLAADLGKYKEWDLAMPLAIELTQEGKPYPDHIPVCFNISHSGERVAVALSALDVGCDVEYRSRNALSIAKRFFSTAEYEYLDGIEDECERDSEFTRLWTMKESVVKCCGEGISHPFGDFSLVDVNGARLDTVRLPGRGEVYRIREFEGENGYCYSVCSLCDTTEDKIRYIKLDQENTK